MWEGERAGGEGTVLLSMDPIFRRATFDEELVTFERWRHLWGDGLTSNRLIERESVLRNHKWGSRVIVYVIADKITNEVYSSCDVYDVPAVLGGASVEILHLASLFTPECYRRRGYASLLIKEVIKVGEKRPGCVGLLLFSDIGPSFYKSLGFFVTGDEEEPYDLLFPAAGGDLESASTVAVEMIRSIDQLNESDFNVNENMEHEQHTATLPIEIPRAEFHILFDSFSPVAPNASTIYSGARVLPCDSSPTGGSIIFTADYSTKELEILSIVASEADVAASLIAAARKEAASRGLLRVRLWYSGSPLQGATRENSTFLSPVASKCILDLKAECVPRKGRLPMMYSFSKELHDLSPVSRVHWW